MELVNHWTQRVVILKVLKTEYRHHASSTQLVADICQLDADCPLVLHSKITISGIKRSKCQLLPTLCYLAMAVQLQINAWLSRDSVGNAVWMTLLGDISHVFGTQRDLLLNLCFVTALIYTVCTALYVFFSSSTGSDLKAQKRKPKTWYHVWIDLLDTRQLDTPELNMLRPGELANLWKLCYLMQLGGCLTGLIISLAVCVFLVGVFGRKMTGFWLSAYSLCVIMPTYVMIGAVGINFLIMLTAAYVSSVYYYTIRMRSIINQMLAAVDVGSEKTCRIYTTWMRLGDWEVLRREMNQTGHQLSVIMGVAIPGLLVNLLVWLYTAQFLVEDEFVQILSYALTFSFGACAVLLLWVGSQMFATHSAFVETLFRVCVKIAIRQIRHQVETDHRSRSPAVVVLQRHMTSELNIRLRQRITLTIKQETSPLDGDGQPELILMLGVFQLPITMETTLFVSKM